jgi:CRISPR-associated protein Csh1
MIHQFVELGDFYRKVEGVDNDLAQYAQDPELVLNSSTVLVIVFSAVGYEGIQVEEYDPSHRLWYLFRPGPSNGFEPTGTSAMPRWNPNQAGDFEKRVLTKLTKRLPKSAESALRDAQEIEDWEREALAAFAGLGSCAAKVSTDIAARHTDPKKGGILTLGWRLPDGQLRRVGDFKAFQQSLAKAGRSSASNMRTVGESTGTGECSICGTKNVTVSGLLRIEPFKFYTVDKPGAVSGGFDSAQAWRNFPVCAGCAARAQFSGERLKKNLTFDYYGFQYLVLPSVVQPNPTIVHELLDRLCQARVTRTAAARLTDAEDELFWAVAQERNIVQLDLVFYEVGGRSFRPALHVSGLIPSHFQALFQARARVDTHPWLRPDVKGSLLPKPYSFGTLRDVLKGFDAEFLEATRAALMRRSFGDRTLIRFGMQLARQDFVSDGKWRQRIGALCASMLFFEELTSSAKDGTVVTVQFGNSPQAERVRRVLAESNGALRGNPEAQAAFVTGACCKRIEQIQQNELGSAPFREKYKALKLAQKDIRQLFVDASAKAQAYEDQGDIVSGLLACAAEALRASPDTWSLAPDEVSYYFALGLALAGRFAKGFGDQEDTNAAESTAAAK